MGLPYKTHRGKNALALVKAYEGIPGAHQHTVRKVVPEALRKLRLAPGRKFCKLGRLSREVGWKYNNVINSLRPVAMLEQSCTRRGSRLTLNSRRWLLTMLPRRFRPTTRSSKVMALMFK